MSYNIKGLCLYLDKFSILNKHSYEKDISYMNIVLKEKEEVCLHTPQLHHVSLQEIEHIIIYAANIYKQQAMYVWRCICLHNELYYI